MSFLVTENVKDASSTLTFFSFSISYRKWKTYINFSLQDVQSCWWAAAAANNHNLIFQVNSGQHARPVFQVNPGQPAQDQSKIHITHCRHFHQYFETFFKMWSNT